LWRGRSFPDEITNVADVVEGSAVIHSACLLLIFFLSFFGQYLDGSLVLLDGLLSYRIVSYLPNYWAGWLA
jgi:hypothetical protein